MEYAIEADALNVNYGKSSILWDISFQIPKGVMVGIIGPNGAGKSTLLKAALNLVSPLSGKVYVQGQVAYIPQKGSLDWDFPITAEEFVLMGRYGNLSLFGRPKKADKKAALHALDRLGMLSFAKRQIREFSGGQQQRLFMARALVQNADILLLDEPFTGVDLTTEKVIVELLRKLKEEGKTVLIVHHDLLSVKEYFDWALLLNTRLLSCGPIDTSFTEENLEKTFGRGQIFFSEMTDFAVKKKSGHL